MSSRHDIPPRVPGLQVVVGWDNPLGSYFAQVHREDAAAADDTRDPTLLWIGTSPEEIRDPADLVAPLRPYARLTDAQLTQLRRDRAADLETPPSPLQRAMRAYLTEADPAQRPSATYTVQVAIIVHAADAVIALAKSRMAEDGLNFDDEVAADEDLVAAALRWLIGTARDVVPLDHGFEILRYDATKTRDTNEDPGTNAATFASADALDRSYQKAASFDAAIASRVATAPDGEEPEDEIDALHRAAVSRGLP